MAPGESREGIAIFPVGREAPDFDKMTISVRGLAELRPLGRDEKGRKFRERVLLLKYEQVSSQWRAGKELKYLPEEWSLDEISLPDRAGEEPEDAAKLKKKLEELLERAKKEEERRKKIMEGSPAPPPPAKSSSGAPPAAIAAGLPVGKPAPDLIATLRKAAASAPPVRATFTEATGRDERRQEVSGTLCVARDGKFAIERNLHPGTERAIKEQRVFDGAHLWIHTAAQGVGDTVRRWTVAATKKEWHTLEGRPEVDFATVANPARAWLVFADDLIFLGAETLSREEAYVFEVRPDKKHEALLSGPLTGELLGKALGRRVRFWIGKVSAFQLRMQVYDDRDQAVAALDCGDLSFDAPLAPETFAFKPPAGVEVTDMNAAYAASEKR
jgi:outer membrane lipoprotein-sorting protein